MRTYFFKANYDKDEKNRNYTTLFDVDAETYENAIEIIENGNVEKLKTLKNVRNIKRRY